VVAVLEQDQVVLLYKANLEVQVVDKHLIIQGVVVEILPQQVHLKVSLVALECAQVHPLHKEVEAAEVVLAA
tara:strand:+ start:253 stop:468 length:216 start_codon:yes stop_codon:yes gene_type:complete